MTLGYLIDNIDKSESNEEWVDLQEIAEEVNLDCWCWGDDTGKKLKIYRLFTWLCTDSHVGAHVLFFEDKPVAVTIQSARKSGVDYEWISVDARNSVRDFLVTLVEADEEEAPNLINLDSEMDDGFYIRYNSQVIQDYATHKEFGKVKIIGCDRKLFHDIEVERVSDHCRMTMDVRDLKFDYYLEKKR